MDLEGEYAKLEAELKADSSRTDYGVMYRYVDRVEDCARRAHAIYLVAKVERARYERECEVVLSAMRAKAQRQLEEEKRSGSRSMLVKDDVRARMLEMFPDEVIAQEDKMLRAKSAEEHLEHFAGLWRSRCSTARTMLETLRK